MTRILGVLGLLVLLYAALIESNPAAGSAGISFTSPTSRGGTASSRSARRSSSSSAESICRSVRSSAVRPSCSAFSMEEGDPPCSLRSVGYCCLALSSVLLTVCSSRGSSFSHFSSHCAACSSIAVWPV